jgi:hypothetical protein
VVNTVSCLRTEVTVLTGYGTAWASTGLDAVTKRKITAHFGNCNPVIQPIITAASYSPSTLKDMKN